MKSIRKKTNFFAGQTFGRLTLIKTTPEKRYGSPVWLCQCSCGNPELHPVSQGNLIRTNSCGCLKKEQAGKASITHGETGSLRHRMWCNARIRAKKLKLACDIELADILIPSKCPVLGIPLSKGSKGIQDGSPSLDRLFPEQGYVKGNIWVISHRANRIKSNSTPKEIKKIITALKKMEGI
jgi:hypothetical protein